MEQRVTFHKMLPKTQSLHGRNTGNRSSMAPPPQTSMAEPSRAHPPPVLVFSSSSVFIFGLFFCVWLKKLYICLVGCGFENLKNGGSCFGHGFFFFSKLIYLWVLGRPKKNGFWFGFVSCDLYVCESKHVCTIIFEEREREICIFEERVRWWGFEEREIWC